MTDQPAPERPDDNIEEEINDLLSEAESLTEELQSEIGDEGTEAGPRENEFFATETDSESSIDGQLAQADAALADAREQIDEEPAPKSATKLKLPPKKKSGEANGQSADSGTESQAVQQLAVARPRKKNTAVDGADAQLTDTGVGAGQEFAQDDFTASDAAEDGADTSSGGFVSRIVAPVSSALAKGADSFGRFLEAIDRPFGRIEYRIRVLLGWSALVLGFAAFWILYFIIL